MTYAASIFVRVYPSLREAYAQRNVFAELLAIPPNIRIEGTYSIEVSVALARQIHEDARDQYRYRKFALDERAEKNAYLHLVRALEDQMGMVPAIETKGDRQRRADRAANPEAAVDDWYYGSQEKRRARDAAVDVIAAVRRAS